MNDLLRMLVKVYGATVIVLICVNTIILCLYRVQPPMSSTEMFAYSILDTIFVGE